VAPKSEPAAWKRTHRAAPAPLFDPAPACCARKSYIASAAAQTGFAPLVPHFANLPFASLQRVGLAGALAGHLTNLPFESRQGAAMDGAEPATRLRADRARMSFRINASLFGCARISPAARGTHITLPSFPARCYDELCPAMAVVCTRGGQTRG